MATELKKITDAYASLQYASYEALAVDWVSGLSICSISSALAHRIQAGAQRSSNKYSTAQQLIMALSKNKKLPVFPKTDLRSRLKDILRPYSPSSRPLDDKLIKPVSIPGFPEAIEYDGKIYPFGVLDFESAKLGDKNLSGNFPLTNPNTGLRQIPLITNKYSRGQGQTIPFQEGFTRIYTSLMSAIETSQNKKENLYTHIDLALKSIGDAHAYHFFPNTGLTAFLSPIGIAHYFRQLFFNISEGVGPIEQAFTIAPLETFEVVYQTVMRRSHEELMETGMESTLTSESEEKNSEEISDKISSMVQRDTAASMSADAKGTIGVWQVEAGATAEISNSSQRAREESMQRIKEITKKASERIHKTYALKTKDSHDYTTTNLQKRIIQNNSPSPVSYGLRRVYRKIQVKVQDLGPRLVWQVYIAAPGEGLGRSKFLYFRESENIAIPEVPPGVRPKPQGGNESGNTAGYVSWDGSRGLYFVTLVILLTPDREITGIRIDSIIDQEGGGKNDEAPTPLNNIQWGASFDMIQNTYTINLGIHRGDSNSVIINYTYSWQPSSAALIAWEAEVTAAKAGFKEQALTEQFQRFKDLITTRSKIPKRPANDLRKEERYEVMNRIISMLFAQGIDASQPNPLEIEVFHKYFDINSLFVHTHPSWWIPRQAMNETGLGRPPYEVTDESDPAPMGSSLGWLLQLDGDDRRNEFINSPWVRSCLPIRAGLETEALNWLSTHIEGMQGYNLSAPPLQSIMNNINSFRQKEAQLAGQGADYVTISSSISAPSEAINAQNVYPIIDQFEVTVPTEGFVYDELKIIT